MSTSRAESIRRWQTTAGRRAFEPFERAGDGSDGPFKIQHDLQGMMQDLVGIVRTAPEMERALEGLTGLNRRAERVAVSGNREYNPGWHTALDLHALLTVSEAVTRAALRRTESRGAHFREDYPAKDEALGRVRFVVKRNADRQMELSSIPVPPLPRELAGIIEEMK